MIELPISNNTKIEMFIQNNIVNYSYIPTHFAENSPLKHSAFHISDSDTVAIHLNSDYLTMPLIISLNTIHCSITLLNPNERLFLSYDIISDFNYIISDTPLDLYGENRYKMESINFLSHKFYRYKISEKRNTSMLKTYTFFTSGTSGDISQVSYTEECVIAKGICEVNILDLSPDDFVLCILPTYHSYGFGFGCIAPAIAGARVKYLSSFTLPTHIINELNSEKYTILITTPFYYNCLYQELLSMKNLRLMISSGGPLSQSVINSGLRVSNCYGTTEAGLIAFKKSFKDINEMSVGMPVNGVEIILGQLLNLDENNTYYELSIKSPYLSYSIKTKDTVTTIESSTLKLNDYGYLDDDGNLCICGRIDNIININGEKVSLNEIENFLLTYDNIKEVKVIKRNDEKHHQYPVAYVVLHNKSLDDAISLRKYCLNKLNSIKIPREFIIVDQLEKTATNKIKNNQPIK